MVNSHLQASSSAAPPNSKKVDSSRLRHTSPPPPTHHGQVEKYPTAHVAASARGRAENKVDSGLPRWVVPVLGAILAILLPP